MINDKVIQTIISIPILKSLLVENLRNIILPSINYVTNQTQKNKPDRITFKKWHIPFSLTNPDIIEIICQIFYWYVARNSTYNFR